MSRALHFRKQLHLAGPRVALLRCAVLYPGLRGAGGFAERVPAAASPAALPERDDEA